MITVGQAGPLPVLAGQDTGGTFTGAAVAKPRYHTAAKDTSGLQVIDSVLYDIGSTQIW